MKVEVSVVDLLANGGNISEIVDQLAGRDDGPGNRLASIIIINRVPFVDSETKVSCSGICQINANTGSQHIDGAVFTAICQGLYGFCFDEKLVVCVQNS